MVREKIILGNYTYLVDFFDAMEYLDDEEHYEYFYIFKNQDFISDSIIDKDIYFISKSNFENKKFTFPLPHGVSTGYSVDCNKFNSNFKEDMLDIQLNKIYDKNSNELKLICDKVRIYLPMINTALDAIIDIENYINDSKFHYFIDLFQNYERKCDTEFKYENVVYSEYIEFYIPSINNLIYSDNIYIKEYNDCYNNETLLNRTYINANDNNDIENNTNILVPFNILYYPYKINKTIYDDGSFKIDKYFNIKPNYIISQFYSAFNVILYPYTGIDDNNVYIIDTDLNTNSNTFSINISFNLHSEIRFPIEKDFTNINDYNKYYGIPCIISKFEFPELLNKQINIPEEDMYLILKDTYLSFNGHIEEDYTEFEENPNKEYDIIFGDDYGNINKTGFFIEFAKDSSFKDVFVKQSMNLDTVIDNFIFPLDHLFTSWNDIPDLIVYRVTYIDKISLNKIVSNPVIITNEWFKYIINEDLFKLKFNKVHKKINGVMQVGNYNDNENPILFIDKINCSIIRNSEEKTDTGIVNKNTPRIIYKPIFYKTTDLQNINLIDGIPQNIGINLGEYFTKVETFKIVIEGTEYTETGRNDVYVLFSINPLKITNKSGRYILINENGDYISNGNYYIS